MGTHAKDTDLLVKTIGNSGQISLGKDYAGRRVTVQRIGEGRWEITEVDIIPKHQRLFHTPEAVESLRRAETWMANNPPRAAMDADIDELERSLTGGKAKESKKRPAKR